MSNTLNGHFQQLNLAFGSCFRNALGWWVGSKHRRVVECGRRRDKAGDSGNLLLRVFRASRHEQETLGAIGSNRKSQQYKNVGTPQPLTLATASVPVKQLFTKRQLCRVERLAILDGMGPVNALSPRSSLIIYRR